MQAVRYECYERKKTEENTASPLVWSAELRKCNIENYAMNWGRFALDVLAEGGGAGRRGEMEVSVK
jgi:hypothetical protein